MHKLLKGFSLIKLWENIERIKIDLDKKQIHLLQLPFYMIHDDPCHHHQFDKRSWKLLTPMFSIYLTTDLCYKGGDAELIHTS